MYTYKYQNPYSLVGQDRKKKAEMKPSEKVSHQLAKTQCRNSPQTRHFGAELEGWRNPI